jgi:hypothetical protein
MGTGESDTAAEVARQIRILLTGLAERAERSGLPDLAVKLRAVAAEAERLARSA